MQESIDEDFTAIDEVFCSLAPAPYWKGGTKIEPEDKVREFYGRDDYSFREHWTLAVARALEKRGYSEPEIAELTAYWMAFCDEESDESEAGGG
jgi:hypothetical protein